MKAYPSYKEYKPSNVDWLGEIPEHWEIRKLKYCFMLKTQKATGARIPVALENIESWTGKYLPSESEFEGDGIAFESHDILFGKLRPYLAKVWAAEFAGEAIGDFFVLHPLKHMNSRFAAYYMRTSDFINLIDGSTFGSKMPRASWDFFSSTPINLPPLSEQQMIADFLDRETAKIDSLIQKRNDLIKLLQEKRSAVISHAVTKGIDPTVRLKPSNIDWLGEIPEHWDCWKISHGYSEMGSGTTPTSDNDAYYDGNINWVTTSELRENIIVDTAKKVSQDAMRDFSALKKYPSGTLLIAMYGATIGRLGILGVEATINQACCALVKSKVFFNLFLFYWFQAYKKTVIILASGGGQPNISQEKIRSLILPTPPFFEQQKITEFLDRETAKIDSLIKKEEKIIKKMKEYRTALISAAVTGKIDVRRKVSHGA